MLKKIATICWYLTQPKGFQLVVNLIKQKTVYRNKERSQTESIQWCSQRAEETEPALKRLFPGLAITFSELRKAFPDEINHADQEVINTPYKMGGAGNMDLLYNVAEIIQARYVAETGVAYGWSSLSILLSICKRDSSLLISTDMPYAKMGNENFVGVAVSDKFKNNWRLIQEPDISGLPKGLKDVEYLDLIHYDSDKSYVGRMKIYPVLYNKLRKGGVFISDDIQDNTGFKDFCQNLNIEPVIISFENKYVGVFIKKD